MIELAIIPARIGSKELPKKNIKTLSGKPLIYWTIKAAQESKQFNRIIVSTDDDKIAQISSDFGVEIPFIRPKYLSQSSSSSIDVIKHSLKFLNYPKNFALLQPTSPLRSAKHIKEAFQKFKINSANSLISLVEGKPLEWAMKLNEVNKITNLRTNIPSNNRRQDFEKIYYPNGAIYYCDTKTFLDNNSFITENTYGYIMDKISSIDIDNQKDLDLAELIISNVNN